MTFTSGHMKTLKCCEIHPQRGDKFVTPGNRYGFLLDPQPQFWPQEDLDFLLKKMPWMKIARVMPTIPIAV